MRNSKLALDLPVVWMRSQSFELQTAIPGNEAKFFLMHNSRRAFLLGRQHIVLTEVLFGLLEKAVTVLAQLASGSSSLLEINRTRER